MMLRAASHFSDGGQGTYLLVVVVLSRRMVLVQVCPAPSVEQQGLLLCPPVSHVSHSPPIQFS